MVRVPPLGWVCACHWSLEPQVGDMGREWSFPPITAQGQGERGLSFISQILTGQKVSGGNPTHPALESSDAVGK